MYKGEWKMDEKKTKIKMNAKTNAQMNVKCDDRENGIVIEELMKMGVECKLCRLKACDYICGDVCVERKTIDDFCGSIMDGRMKGQVKKMQKFKHKYILISGRIGDRKADIGENCVLGMISSLVVGGMNVVCIDNDKQLAFLMKRIFERYFEESKK